MATSNELEFVAWMARLGREDRDLYRLMRKEAWDLVQANHAAKDAQQLDQWRRGSS